MLPVIGVTASVSDDRLSFQQKRMYCEAISACGGLPLILPPQEDVSRASHVLSLLDGLLLAGGDDIDPHYYGEEALPECGLITPHPRYMGNAAVPGSAPSPFATAGHLPGASGAECRAGRLTGSEFAVAVP